MSELSIEHILLFVIAAYLLYNLTSGCRGNGFSVGGQLLQPPPASIKCIKALINAGCNNHGGDKCNECIAEHESELQSVCRADQVKQFCE